MALSGLALVVFAIGHMAGNLQIFLGPEAINRYAHFLQSTPEILWPVRLGLLGLAILHIVTALALWRENNLARPQEYSHGQPPFGASLASRTMIVSGLIVACFLVYHLLHYTVKLQAINLGAGDFGALTETLRDGTTRPHVYNMVVAGFSQPLVSLFYALGVGLLCFHLSHGIAAMFQSLGCKNGAWGPLIDQAAKVIAVVLCVGYLSVPAGVIAKVIKPDVRPQPPALILKHSTSQP